MIELVELTEIVGLVPLLSESHVDDRDLNMIGESPMKLGGRDVRFYAILFTVCACVRGWDKKEIQTKEKKIVSGMGKR